MAIPTGCCGRSSWRCWDNGLWTALWPSYYYCALFWRVSRNTPYPYYPFCNCLISRSQPFWGNMVAGSGAGPEPIPQKSLTATNLSDAIKHCLRPEASSAAQEIANLMKAESGVEAAVASFHRCLPLDKMRCHILSDEPAVWKYKNSLTEPLFLSKTAARLLVEGSRVNPKDLKL